LVTSCTDSFPPEFPCNNGRSIALDAVLCVQIRRVLSLCISFVFHPVEVWIRHARLSAAQFSRPSFVVSLRYERVPPSLAQL
jgi:hypothetical protein